MKNQFPERQKQPLKILLIEDNPDDVVLIEELLTMSSDMNYQLLLADCLASGLKQLSTELIDLILLDLGLPDSQGLDTLNKVLDITRQVPVVVLTGLDNETVGLQAVHYGAQDYLSKNQIQGPILGRTIRYAIERQQVKKQEQLMINMLGIMNRSDNTINIIRDILLMIKEYIGIEAVGIRLKEGEDFPYYQTSGFPDNFVQMENHLCAYDLAGQLLQDECGNPVLECMCGNVICGRTDAKLPFFTESGSFWSNCTTDLLASTTENERQAHTRNRCNSEGYESVALIPLKAGDEVIGLLQLNDHRRNQFTLELITFLEGISASIGIALTRMKMKDEMENTAREWQTTFDASSDAIWLLNTEHRVIRVNKTSEKIFHRPVEELTGKHCWEIVHGTAGPILECPVLLVQKTMCRAKQIMQIGERWFEITCDPILDKSGHYIGATHIFSDITERKRSEEHIISQLNELQRWQDVMLDREDRVQELKREVNEFCHRLNETVRYLSQEDEFDNVKEDIS